MMSQKGPAKLLQFELLLIGWNISGISLSNLLFWLCEQKMPTVNVALCLGKEELLLFENSPKGLLFMMENYTFLDDNIK